MAEHAEGSALRVLLVEDNPTDARLIQATLATSHGGDFEVVCVGRLSEAMDRVHASWPDLVLLDLSLPDARGLEGVTRIRTAAPQLAVIVLTGASDTALAQKAFRTGVRDYIVKDDISAAVLLRAIRYSIECQALESSMRGVDADMRALVEATGGLVLRLSADGAVEALSAKHAGGIDLEGVETLSGVVTEESAAEVLRRVREPGWGGEALSFVCRLARGDHETVRVRVARGGEGVLVLVLRA